MGSDGAKEKRSLGTILYADVHITSIHNTKLHVTMCYDCACFRVFHASILSLRSEAGFNMSSVSCCLLKGSSLEFKR